MPGRHFVNVADFDGQFPKWVATVVGLQVHGTTHECPIYRFARERQALLPSAGQGRFRLHTRIAGVVAEDYLVSFETNPHSVPFHLICPAVEVQRKGRGLRFAAVRRRLASSGAGNKVGLASRRLRALRREGRARARPSWSACSSMYSASGCSKAPSPLRT